MIQDQLKNKKVIVYGEAMYDYLKASNNNLIKYSINAAKKINKLIACLKLAIKHVDVDTHVYKIN